MGLGTIGWPTSCPRTSTWYTDTHYNLWEAGLRRAQHKRRNTHNYRTKECTQLGHDTMYSSPVNLPMMTYRLTYTHHVLTSYVRTAVDTGHAEDKCHGNNNAIAQARKNSRCVEQQQACLADEGPRPMPVYNLSSLSLGPQW